MEPVDALAEQLEEHDIEDTGRSGESHSEAVQDLKQRGVFFLVTSGSNGRANNKKGFGSLPKIDLVTAQNIFTFKVHGGMHLRFKAKVKFVNKRVWGRGTTEKNKQAMRLAYQRVATFSSAVKATPMSSSHKFISMSVDFAQILAPMYRELIPVIKHATRWDRGVTKVFLKMFPGAYEKLAWHLMDKALKRCGYGMRQFVPRPLR